MSFRIGDRVVLNPAVVTKELLHDCYFDTSIPKILDAAEKRKAFTIKEFKREHLRSSATYIDCAVLYDEDGIRLGWLPLKALAPLSSNYLPALIPGRILKTREGVYYIIANKENAFVIHLLMGGKESLSNWDVYTGKHCSRKDFDIVAVYNSDDMCGFKGIATAVPIWTETTPAREMTVAEIEKELGHGIKVVGEDRKEWEF